MLIIGSKNNGKIKEFKELLSKLPLTLGTLNKFNFYKEIKENGCSFKENSYKKAYKISKELNLPIIADDSGLIVTALNNRPGIHSSRYISDNADNFVKCNKILNELSSKKNRKAFFKCMLSIVLPNGTGLFYKGICIGLISKKFVKANGFGYDPIFIHRKSGRLLSKMDSKKKGKISHRGISIKNFFKDKKKFLSLV